MSAYFIVFVEEPVDQQQIDLYRKEALPSLVNRNIRFLARPDCELHTIEGDPVDVVVMIEFESVDAAKAWYYSAEYQAAVKRRHSTARSRAVIVAKAGQASIPTDLVK